MCIPYDGPLGVHPQSEGFTGHQVWDFAATTAEQYPLLLHFPYFDLYRKQVVKQADLVLAMHRRRDAFTPAQKAANFAYYERLTVRDSSLSAGTQAVIAAEIGHLQLAYDYLAEAALMDLDDLEHNTRDGLHMAALAGCWIALVAGLAGMRHHDGTLSFAPRLPPQLTRLAFTITLRGRRLRRGGDRGDRDLHPARRCTVGHHPPRAAHHHLGRNPGCRADPASARAGTDTHATTRPGTGPATAIKSTSDDHSTDRRDRHQPNSLESRQGPAAARNGMLFSRRRG